MRQEDEFRHGSIVGKRKEEEKPFEWTEEKLKDVYSFIQSIADKYLEFKKEEASADTKYTEPTYRMPRAYGAIEPLNP